MTVNIKKLFDGAIVPTRGSNQAAGYDLYACMEDPQFSNDIWVQPHQTVKIGTGVAMEIPEGYFGAIFARSGLATKKGLRPSNCVGVVDSDYRGEIIVAIHNDSDSAQCITLGDRIGQMVIIPYLQVEYNVVDELRETERGEGGFGSTGK